MRSILRPPQLLRGRGGGWRLHTAPLLGLAMVLVSCSDVASEQPDTTGAAPTTQAADTGSPASGGVLVYGMWEDPDSLDATFSFTGGANKVYGSMCETLFDLGPDYQIRPRLAADLPTVSDDGMTVTIPIRQDALFNDGTPLNAEAVKITLDKHRTSEGSNRIGDLVMIESVSVVDEYTVEISLGEAASGPLTGNLVMQAGVIQSPTQLEALGDDFSDHPVCVGPFSFVERVPGDHVRLEKSEHYYDADRVFLDGVIFRIIDDDAVRTANLRSGDIHISDTILTSDLPGLESDPNFAIHPAPWLGFDALYINMSNAAGRAEPPGEVDTPLARDPRIREALELSLDRGAINEILYNGYHQPGCTPFSPAHPYHMADIECSERDLDRARELLAEAGDPNPSIELLVRQVPEFIQLGEILKSMIEEAGFSVNIQPRDVTAAVNAYFAGEYEIFQNGWTGRIDPFGSIDTWHVVAPNSPNPFFGMGEPATELDQQIADLLIGARGGITFEDRYPLYRQAVDLAVNERRNAIYLFHRINYAVAHANVEGFSMSADLRPRFIDVTLGG